jgi:hypothetical protein
LDNFKISRSSAGQDSTIEIDCTGTAYLRNMYIYSASTDNNASAIAGQAGNFRVYNSVFAIYPYTGNTGSVILCNGATGNFYNCEAFGVAEALTYWGDYLPDLVVFYGVKDGTSYSYP